MLTVSPYQNWVGSAAYKESKLMHSKTQRILKMSTRERIEIQLANLRPSTCTHVKNRIKVLLQEL